MLLAVAQQFCVHRHWRSYPQTLARPVVDLVSDGIQLCLAVNRQVCSFWQVLANQPIHVLVGASLPRAVRFTKVHRNARVVAQLLVQRHLTVPAERLSRWAICVIV
jgi:hypothetical protein